MNKKNYIWFVIGFLIILGIVWVIIKGATFSGPVIIEKNGANPATSSQVSTAATTTTAATEFKQQTVNAQVILEANGAVFTPKTIEVQAGSRTFITFSAQDAVQHTFASDDPKLPVLVIFSKKEGIKSTSFDTPPVGSYTFYVDSKDNTGTLIVK